MTMRKILIVDDTAMNRRILKQMLEDEYRIAEAATGEEALEILAQDHRDISAVLLDIALPGIDGYSVLTSIRTDRRFSKMPVVMITASDDEATRVKSLELSANDFVMKPYSSEILKHCLQNNIALSEATAPRARRGAGKKRGPVRRQSLSMRVVILACCAAALVISLCVQHFLIRRDLRDTCRNVTADFTEIMDSYRHSFRMFELLLQEEIRTAADPDEIERFLKSRDLQLQAIEGGDYDGVYMYYSGRYLYSWDTPYSAYAQTGYDATTRPWYIGAVTAQGEIFFSTPYPSYANDYMLATISRLQDDGQTVIAYDIKLGEIGKFVDRLNLYNGALALICDRDGNIIGCTNHLYLGGNYTLSPEQLSLAVAAARETAEDAGPKDDGTAAAALQCAEAQQQFAVREQAYLSSLLARSETLRYSVADLSFGYAHANDEYTCFVISPAAAVLPQAAVLWAALSFAFISLAFLVKSMLRKSQQILCDALTGLNNRRAFLKYCDNHMLHHALEPLGLLMLDLNHFKRINDLCGHAVGDQALLDTAAVLKSACGASSDNYFLCRYGGDEFLLAARIADVAALDAMRRLISDEFRKKNQTSVTPYMLEPSMGAACGACTDKRSLEALLTLADQAMYSEKRQAARAWDG